MIIYESIEQYEAEAFEFSDMIDSLFSFSDKVYESDSTLWNDIFDKAESNIFIS